MIRTVPETGSTNADLIALLAAGGRWGEGRWLVADRQTAGRGRQGRAWFDGAGNFMGSTLVRLSAGDPPAPTLALVAGLAVYEAAVPLVPDQEQMCLKWPNDLMLGGSKLAGILLERGGDAVVVGIGVNLAAAPEVSGRATTSLADHGANPDRDSFARALADSFDRELERWRQHGLDPLLRRWSAAAYRVGTPLTVSPSGETPIGGTFAGLSPEGALLLRLADGTVRAIHAGDVTLARPKDD